MFLGFAALLLIISTLLWSYARAAANRSYDLLLAGAALSILERVSLGTDGATVDLPHSALEILGLAPDDRAFYAVSSDRGGLLTGMAGLPAAPPSETRPRFFDAAHGGELTRFVVQGRQLSGASGREWVSVQIGQTRRARDAQAVSLFATAVGGLAIRRALGPLALIERDLRAREPSDLSALALEPPREVESLIGSINGFITRLTVARDQSERFIADVAHQMRTSLSALQGQLALAADAPDEEEARRRLARAEEQGARTVRLTNQLLAHAMVTHRAGNPVLRTERLAALVRELLAEMLRETALRRLTVAFDGEGVEDGSDLIRCDPVSVREALRNLVENAVRHGPPDNRVEVAVRVDARSGRVIASVADTGPGIPATARERALERFATLGTASAGSGLGLSIVAAVAEAHGATLALERAAGGGLLASLAFAPADTARARGGAPVRRTPAAGEALGGGERSASASAAAEEHAPGTGASRRPRGRIGGTSASLSAARRDAPASASSHAAAGSSANEAGGAPDGRDEAARGAPRNGGGAPLALLALVGLTGVLGAAPLEATALRVWSTTDADAVVSLIERFEADNPGTTVDRREFSTVELHAAMLAAPDPAPDVVVSSAMDLQLDLVNRGLAHRMPSLDVGALPDWASWRAELFGFTFEPAAMIYDRALFDAAELPRGHGELARFVRENERRLAGRIGTYDIVRSGLGYLYATQDAIQGQQSLRVAEALGRAEAQVFCCSSAISDALLDGRLALGFNVIGSYALARAKREPRLGVAFFEDYNLVMARTAFVPRAAPNKALAERYVGFLVSAAGQRAIARDSALLPIDRRVLDGLDVGLELARLDGSWLPIRLSPALLTYLDTLKRERFVQAWEEAIQRSSARADGAGR